MRLLSKLSIYCAVFASVAGNAGAQVTDTVEEFKPSGKLWGYTFGDYAYKSSTDNISPTTIPIYRGGVNQYTGMPANTNMFQFRRIYLGYNYDISRRFSAEFLLAAEDNFNNGLVSQGGGDLTVDGKFAPYVKLANIRWKNLWRNTDLVIGSQSTPSFAKTGRNDQTAEEIWAYRSVERTITDIRRTLSFDLGASLQGWFDHEGRFGYDVMVSNGTGARPEIDQYKLFSGDIYGKFFDRRLVVNIYQNYQRLNWGVRVAGYNGPRYHDQNMTKVFAAWNTKLLTVGAEAFMNTLMADVEVTGKDNNKYYRTTKAMGMSFFVRGRILSNENGNALLSYFARYDNYDPTGNLSNIAGEANTRTYTGTTLTYEPTTKEQFITLGLDFTPYKNIHFMPNVWMNTYTSALSANGANTYGTPYSGMNGNVSGVNGTDMVYRLTFYYVYGK